MSRGRGDWSRWLAVSPLHRALAARRRMRGPRVALTVRCDLPGDGMVVLYSCTFNWLNECRIYRMPTRAGAPSQPQAGQALCGFRRWFDFFDDGRKIAVATSWPTHSACPGESISPLSSSDMIRRSQGPGSSRQCIPTNPIADRLPIKPKHRIRRSLDHPSAPKNDSGMVRPRACSLEIDSELELRGLPDRQLGGVNCASPAVTTAPRRLLR
jgi:hypothetical protein